MTDQLGLESLNISYYTKIKLLLLSIQGLIIIIIDTLPIVNNYDKK